MIPRRTVEFCAAFACAALACAQQGGAPAVPPGALVELGGHRLHVNCKGKGAPTVVVENGFDEFSFDWTAVQEKLAPSTRICTYDRAGYAWSDPGPVPRTFDQMKPELHDALEKRGENGPFVLVGHAFGGPVARNFALAYPADVAGMVFVDAVSEDDRFEMWHRAVLNARRREGKISSCRTRADWTRRQTAALALF